MGRPPHHWLRYVAYGLVGGGVVGAFAGDDRDTARLLLIAGGVWSGIFALIDWARRQ